MINPMDLGFFENAASNLSSIESSSFMNGLQSLSTPSPGVLSMLSSISIEQVLWIGGALMIFRIFAGTLFAILGMIGVLCTTLTSIFCTLVSVFLRIIRTAVNSFLNLFGASVGLIISSPMKIISSILSRWGQFLVPVAASALMSTIYLQDNFWSGWVSKITPEATWVAIDESTCEQNFERF